jgi:hypothetical protein
VRRLGVFALAADQARLIHEPSKSEDGSAATGQMVMRSFTSFLSYVLLPPQKKKKFCLRVSVRLASHVPRRAPLKLCRCRLSWVPSTNYVPIVL